MLQDFYSLLGVTPQASITDIKKAYRNLAKQYHPDVVGDNAEKLLYFSHIKNAYETLTNNTLRYQYHEKRWLQKSEGKEISTYKITTATSIYKDYVQLEKAAYFNNNRGNCSFIYANKISEILNQKNIEILNQKNENELNNGIVAISLKIIPYLPKEYYNTFLEKIKLLNFQNRNYYLQKIETKIKKQIKIFILEKYKWVGVVVLTFLLLGILKRMVS